MAIHCLKLGDALCFPRRLSVHGVRMDRSQPPLQHHGVRIDIVGWRDSKDGEILPPPPDIGPVQGSEARSGDGIRVVRRKREGGMPRRSRTHL